MKRIIYTLVQCTWGIIQTSLGFVLFLINIKNKHYIYKGAIVTQIEGRYSVSLGLFIFISNKQKSNSKILIHEYGHTIQSLILGPLYLIIIGIPSFLWATLPYFEKRRNRSSYYSFYTERNANYFGKLVTKEKI